MTKLSPDSNSPARNDPSTARKGALKQNHAQLEARAPQPMADRAARIGVRDATVGALEFPARTPKLESPPAAGTLKPAIAPFTRLFIATVDAILHLPAPGDAGGVRGASTFAREGDLRRFLEPTLQKLVKRGALHSVRGPRGGYALGKRRSDISLAELLDVTISEKRSERAKILPKSHLGRVVDSVLSELELKWTRDLRRVTIEELHAKKSVEARK